MHTGSDPLKATIQAREFFERQQYSSRDLVQSILLAENGAKSNGAIRTTSLRELPNLIHEVMEAGVAGVKLFAKEGTKDEGGTLSIDKNNLLCRAIRETKRIAPKLYVAVETCLCGYTTAGTCGIHKKTGEIDLIESAKQFGNMAVIHAEQGADAVGPAGMIEGTIRASKEALSANGLAHVAVMPHMIFRSPLYAPYRKLMATGDGQSRDCFHLAAEDKNNALEWVANARAEGADSILLEPALFILDIISEVTSKFPSIPFGCFSVTGEFHILRSYCDNRETASTPELELWKAAKRAGARFIVTYGAVELAKQKGIDK